MTIVKFMITFYNRYVMISYKPFWDTLTKKNITTYSLINKYGVSSATINRIKNGGGITTAKINDFCKILDCNVSDIIVYKKDKK